MKRRALAAASAVALYSSCAQPTQHHATVPTTTTLPPPEAADPTELDWEALARWPKPERAARSKPRIRLAPVPTGDDVLACIRRIESGGDYRAVSPSGRYRGAYQFDQRTFESVGGRGDPAEASPAEQDAAATTLLSRRGLQPWPTPSRRCA